MIATFLILLREGLEIALILSIILAATRGVAGRGRMVALGVAGGIIGSLAVAFFAENISSALEGLGQEIFNAAILLTAALMIGWTVVWMQSHGRELAQKMKHIGHGVKHGELPLYSLAVVICLSMWREGAEIVLFMYGVMGASQEPMLALIGGGLAGAATAAAIGLLLYFGLMKIPTRHVFSTTGWLLTLLASGMSAQAAGYLTAADLLPTLSPEVWDSSWLLSENSVTGKILHATVGYMQQPSGIQLVFYAATASSIIALLVRQRQNRIKHHTA